MFLLALAIRASFSLNAQRRCDRGQHEQEKHQKPPDISADRGYCLTNNW
jgi:hypothetical protein